MKNRKLWVAILSGFMAGVMLLGLILSILPATVFAEKTSDEIKQEMGSLAQQQNEIGEKMSEIQSEKAENQGSVEEMVQQKDHIDQQIGLLSTQIGDLDEQIRNYSQLISQKQVELDQAESVLSQLNEKNQERIRAMEEQGKVSYWSVIFKAKSYADLIDRLNMVEEIQNADRRRLEELAAAAKVVADARQELENEKNGLQTAREEQVTAQAELKEKRAEADEILVELNARQRELDSMFDEYAAQEDALTAEIAAAEQAFTAALRQEQEAAKPKPPETSEEGDSLEGESSSDGESSEDDNIDTESSGGGIVMPEPSGWVSPCSYIAITSPYGWRVHPITGESTSFHTGVDLANDEGTPIYAAKSGIVTTAMYSGVYGNYVTINHGDGYSTLYGHMTNYVVSEGESVSAGQLIGYMGSTGWSTGPHLHFTVYYEGSTVNPMDYI